MRPETRRETCGSGSRSRPSRGSKRLSCLRSKIARSKRSFASSKRTPRVAHPALPAGGADAAREFAQDIERWYDEAGSKARTGINWSHDWGARSHAYKPGRRPANLLGSANRNKQNAVSH